MATEGPLSWLKTAGMLCSAAIVGGGLIWKAAISTNDAEHTSKNFTTYKAEATVAIERFQKDVNERLDGVRVQLNDMQRDRIDVQILKQREAELRAKEVEQDTRLNKLEEGQYQIRSDVTGLQRGSAAGPRPPGR